MTDDLAADDLRRGARRGLGFASLILAGEIIFLLPFILPRLFRPMMLVEWGVTNAQLGTAMSTYGIVAVLAYLLGGPLADRFGAKRMMVAALLLTAAAGALLLGKPTPLRLALAYASFGCTTILLFWSALIRATHEMGGVGKRGISFGIVEAGRGFVAAVLGWITTREMTGQGQTMQGRVLLSMLLIACAALAVGVLLRTEASRNQNTRKSFDRKLLVEVFQSPAVWAQCLVLLAAYNGYRAIDLFGVYATSLLDWTSDESAGFVAKLLWLRIPAALLGGWLVDRVHPGRLLAVWLSVLLVSSLWIGYQATSFDDASSPAGGLAVPMILFTMVSSGVSAYALRGIYFAMFEQIQVRPQAIGTAAGIVSCVGFLPDIYFAPITGAWIDSGAIGFQKSFFLISATVALGIIAALFQSGKLRH